MFTSTPNRPNAGRRSNTPSSNLGASAAAYRTGSPAVVGARATPASPRRSRAGTPTSSAPPLAAATAGRRGPASRLAPSTEPRGRRAAGASSSLRASLGPPPPPTSKPGSGAAPPPSSVATSATPRGAPRRLGESSSARAAGDDDGGSVASTARARQGLAAAGAASNAAEDEDGADEATLTQRRVRIQPGTVLARDDLCAVSVFSTLPEEVQARLLDADPYLDAFYGSLDVGTGFALLVSQTQCFVWSFASSGALPPVCYEFSIPSEAAAASSTSAGAPLPFAALVPKPPSSAREPGLLLVTPRGELYFWDALAAAAVSVSADDRVETLRIALGVGESVSGLVRCQASSYAIATTASRRFLVSIYPQSGRLVPTLSAFAQPRGLLGRLFGSAAGASAPFSLGGAKEDEATPMSALPGSSSLSAQEAASGAWELWTAAGGKGVVQKWVVVERAGERLVVEQDVRQLIASSAAVSAVASSEVEDGTGAGAVGGGDTGAKTSAPNVTDIRIEDVAALRDGSALALYSHQPTPGGACHFGTARLSVGAGSIVVTKCRALRYTAHRDPRRNAGPKLSVPHSGPAVFVTFPTAVLLLLLDDDFEDVVGLADAARNRIVAVGCESAQAESATRGGGVVALSCVTTRSSTLLVEMECDEAARVGLQQRDAAERALVATQRLKAKIEQAVFYGDDSLNPISFDLPASFEGDLITAAESLSYDIVTSECPALPELVDQRQQLALRQYRLVALIQFIRRNGLLGKLSSASRRRLRADAELVAAAQELWLHYNNFIRAAHKVTAALADPLADSVGSVMAEIGDGVGSDDFIRRFFKHRIDHVGLLLAKLRARVSGANPLPLEARSREILELNSIVLALFHGARRYREEHGEPYGLRDTKPSYEAWTCTPGSIEILESLFHASHTLIDERKRSLGTFVDAAPSDAFGDGDATTAAGEQASQQRLQRELKVQLCELANYVLSAYEERVSYLTALAPPASTSSSAPTGVQKEQSVLQARYLNARPQVIQPLANIGRLDRALVLAEQHRDFRTLTELCQIEASGGGGGGVMDTSSRARLQHYLQRYRQAFASELYQWWVERGEVRTLLEQDDAYSELVQEFLDSTEHARVGWLHDVRRGRLLEASRTLLEEASHESSRLEAKRQMLSVGKLAYVAQLTEPRLALESEQRRIELIDDQLDLVTVHARLRECFAHTLFRGLDADAVENLAPRRAASRLEGAPALQAHFASLVRRLFEGEVLTSEELIDVLTLKDTPAEDLEDLFTAVEVFVRTKGLPLGRSDFALASIWVRVILYDDWETLMDTTGLSDDEMADLLRSTALFSVLKSTLADESTAAVAILTPSQCVERRATKELLLGRYATMPEQQASVLLDDLGSQTDRVASLLRGQSERGETPPPRLSTWFEECARLARRELLEVEVGGQANEYGAGSEAGEAGEYGMDAEGMVEQERRERRQDEDEDGDVDEDEHWDGQGKDGMEL